jgi:hypothetical protein
MADRVTIVSPRDPWPFSSVTADDLGALVADGLLRPLSGDSQPEWMAPPSGAAPSPPPGYVVSFVSFHERGFGVPASHFMWAILHVYGVELHNLSPNSISQAAIVAAVCEGYLGIDPHWDLWTHLFSAELFASPTGERRVRTAVRAGGCILQLRKARVPQYIPAILASSNKGWQRRWFYLRNDDGRLSSFSQRVVSAAADNWRYGTPRDSQKNLQPLLKALEELRRGGLTAAGVVAAIHRRRVLPLTERRLPLWEMTSGADLEGLRISSDPLPVDKLHRRVAITLGKPDAGALFQPLMRPDRGCVSLVSVRSFFSPCVGLPSVLTAETFRLFPGGRASQAFPATGPEGRSGPSCAEGCRGEEEGEKGREEGLGPRADAGSGRLGEAPSSAGEGWAPEGAVAGDARAGWCRRYPGPSSQPPSRLVPSVPGAWTSGSRSEERGQTEGVPDPSAGEVEVTPGSQAELPVPREPSPVPAA